MSKDILISLFKIRYNPLLIVEKNTGPISSVSGWVSISKSVPGETYYSKPGLHKNRIIANSDLCSYRICVCISTFVFKSFLEAQDTNKHCISWWPHFLQIKITLIKTWSQINNTAPMTSTKILFGGSQWKLPTECEAVFPWGSGPKQQIPGSAWETGAPWCMAGTCQGRDEAASSVLTMGTLQLVLQTPA